MAGNKKRRRLPEEDLEAAVADIINSPITRSNLSFLRPLAEPSPVIPPDLEPETPGIESIPQGDLTIPGGHHESPMGDSPTPQGDSKLPNGVDSQIPEGLTPKPMGLSVKPEENVARVPVQPRSQPKTLWQVEGQGTLIDEARVRRITHARDALSLVEEKVYDLLWAGGTPAAGGSRLVHCSLQRISLEARINIKTVRELLPRLIEKGFLAIQHQADARRNIPTLYRVPGYAEILSDQQKRGRLHLARTGRGVMYVHPVSAVLTAADDLILPMGVESSPMGVSPKPPGTEPMGLSVKPMSAPIYGAIADSIQQALGTQPDDAFIEEVVAACQRNAIETTGQPATQEELLYFIGTKAQAIARAANIRNHLAVLRKAAPECFLGDGFRAYRLANTHG